ncbi:MAG: vitamin K epoxide reductase family protein [Candidatus Nanopelagicales bacterium]
MASKTKRTLKSSRTVAWLIIIAGFLGLAGATQLTLEKIHLLEDPNFIPSCTLNPIFSCGNVMMSWQASALGPPNMLIGIAAYAAVITFGVLALAGTKLPRWTWGALSIGTLLGVIYSMWLMTQSFYVIGNLCLYCMLVWAVSIALFVGTTLFSLRSGVFGGSQGLRDKAAAIAPYSWVIVIIWYAIIFALLIIRFPNALVF